ncbi:MULTISPECIES: hypothetical protein [unclassified Rhodococcus (in: high G+C Gram-positive bacteria)]|uniref:hypothetical protein n=1 Tax=unclassified Rhodococcus (in: high G+C Gram-positive bacteria) TaxID=192944 RepID=UPI0006FC1ED6|nr:MULTISPECIES: hypothetical protein [unclassified Rhodococcus (in: high G+C Gram-positive bacteria)]KQU28260.1 hypothetical protein ASG69_09530 [Rhodococcus sp. Leaf225]KQU46369.1 hypothetical protein ASH03_06565 [Rhodococcus sp. Leaf258]
MSNTDGPGADSPDSDGDELLRAALPEAETWRTIKRTAKAERAALDRERERHERAYRARVRHTDEMTEAEARRRANGERPNLTPENFGAMVSSDPIDPDAEQTPVGKDWF